MAVFIRNVHYSINEVALAQELRPVLHGPPFSDAHDSLRHATPMNFHVRLIPDKRVRHSHTGKGVITFPSQELANLAVRHFTHVRHFSVRNKVIYFEASREPPQRPIMTELQLMPYRDPQEALQLRDRLADIRSSEAGLQVRNVQFMYECRDWALSPEWEWNQDSGLLLFPLLLRLEETTRELVIEKFENEVNSTMIRIRYLSIECIDLDTKTCSFVMFLTYAPSYEQATHSVFGHKIPRQKLIALNSGHMEVAPFTWCCIRVILDSFASIDSFKLMAEKVKIPVTEKSHEVSPRARYSLLRRRRMEDWLATIDWEIAFQYEMIYRKILLDPKEIWSLKRPTEDTIASRLGVQGTINVLRRFQMKLSNTNWAVNKEIRVFDLYRESVIEVADLGNDLTFETGTSHFLCYHVTFTPSLFDLEGPFLDVSNRILRAYPEHQNHFLRVSFRDEEGLNFRFDRREIDGSGFVYNRVGNILKNGFVLCGRPYEFLSYSQSALKEYTVWFVSPFKRGNVVVDSEYIRSGIGTRWSEDLLRCPARYAARLSQAFTATDRGLIVEEDQIELIPDIERNDYCFTDGNGLISLEMAKAIYAGIKGRQPTELLRTPSVFQLRLQGAKGIITVDASLSGLILQLRPSMVKFDSRHSEVEIARSFERPVRFFLNRPLTMILAGLGVLHSVFLKLQRLAVRETEEAIKGFKKAAGLFDTHGLGTPFSLSAIFQNLRRIGVLFEKGPEKFIDPFMDRCLQYAVHHVLREMKNKGRVPVPGCWKLVGTVDVYNELAWDEIFVQIIRGPGARPEYLQGPILMAKSPTIHPGDVQLVYAIGRPPPNSHLRHLANCVVFSQQGDRPLPNKLSGSDLDGDEYDLIPLRELHPPRTVDPGSYPPAPRKLLDRRSTIHDIADFVVDYINNDMLGIIATNFLLIADRHSIFHEDCTKLAALHSWAVDFPKNGEPVPSKDIPYPDSRIKPDWYAPEINTRGHADYYESKSILGVLFRDIELPHINPHPTGRAVDDVDDAIVSITNTLDNLHLSRMTLSDAVSRCLQTQLERFIDIAHAHETATAVLDLFSHFSVELDYIAHSCSLSIRSVRRLSEEEILIGTIIGKTSQHRVRQLKISAMRDATGHLVKRTLEELEGGVESPIKDWANRAWTAWKISIMKRDTFGAKCFGFVALRALFDVLNLLDTGTDIGDY